MGVKYFDDYLEWYHGRPYQPEGSKYRIVREPEQRFPVFLSVVMRTQGKRMPAMLQAIESLKKQSDQDFELIVVAHNVSHDVLSMLESVIEDQAPSLRERFSLLSVEGGSRSRPLNVGFWYAQGAYITIFDDDDLVFSDWVSETKRMASSFRDAVIYSYVLLQPWGMGCKGDDSKVPQPLGETFDIYCHPFTVCDLIRANHCPSLGLAYPSEVFKQDGACFDEDMDVLEDWDFLLQAVLRRGIAINEHATSLYRQWEEGETSHQLNDVEKWRISQLRIRQKLNDMPLLLPAGSASYLEADEAGEYLLAKAANPRLFVDCGDGFSEQTAVYPSRVTYDNTVNILFFDNLRNFGQVFAVRFDPTEHGFVTVESLLIIVVTEDSEQLEFAPGNIEISGVQINDTDVAFAKDDPRIVAFFSKPHVISTVTIRYRLKRGISDDAFDVAIEHRANELLATLQPVKKKSFWKK